jgi:endo-1,4-beta-D-glucanase Y
MKFLNFVMAFRLSALRNIMLVICIPFLFNSFQIFAQECSKPFPQHTLYYGKTIIPNHIAQNTMDDSVRSFYNQWKARYLKENNCGPGFYIWSENAGKNHQAVSEGQGYGMVIVALMAGFDPQARYIFDGLFHYYQSNPSIRDARLMSWAQDKNCKTRETSSATDGDIDIAYSLLLASTQWPITNGINYKEEARKMITAIAGMEINKNCFSVLQSNSIESDSPDYYDMRSSDFIPQAFKSFFDITEDSIWEKTINGNYGLFKNLQQRYSPEAGLVPDFIQHIRSHPQPARPNYLESRYDGYYNYNACRVPWRVATDYIINGDQRSKSFLTPINKWIRETTNNNPDNISAGYSLAGNDIPSRNFEALSFISSFAIAAMVDSNNQDWLNKLWDYIIQFKLRNFDYYDNSIKMLQLIILSHNYWAPDTMKNN